MEVSVGDTVQMDYNGPGYDPVFEVVEVEHDYHIHLSNGATVYPKDFDRGTFEIVEESQVGKQKVTA